MELNGRDVRHYSSIAYALRAILAVTQDRQWGDTETLLPLAEDAIDVVRESIDVLTLAALALADREARAISAREITPALFTAAWRQLVAGAEEATRAASNSAGAAQPEGESVLHLSGDRQSEDQLV